LTRLFYKNLVHSEHQGVGYFVVILTFTIEILAKEFKIMTVQKFLLLNLRQFVKVLLLGLADHRLKQKRLVTFLMFALL
jgi:hypothetical protein